MQSKVVLRKRPSETELRCSAKSGTITFAGGRLQYSAGVVEFDFVGTFDDPYYVFANYTSLIGTTFASVVTPAGYAIDYNYLGGNQIALVQQFDPVAIPEPGSLLLWGSVAVVVGMALRRRRKFSK